MSRLFFFLIYFCNLGKQDDDDEYLIYAEVTCVKRWECRYVTQHLDKRRWITGARLIKVQRQEY